MKRIFAYLAVIFLAACNSSSDPDPEVVGINLAATPLSIAAGDSTTLRVDLVYDDGSTTSLSSSQVSFSLSDDEIASLNGTEVVGIQEGNVNVSASYQDYSDTTTVSIRAAEMRGIVLSDEEISLALGQSYSLEIYVRYSDSRVEPLDGASVQIMDMDIVDFDYNAESLRLQTYAVGHTEVLVTHEQLEATLVVEVSDAVAKRIVVGLDDARIAAGETTRVFATATLTDNNHMDVTENTVFSTQSSNIKIDGSQVTALGAGGARIDGVYEGLSADVDIEVTAAIVTGLVIEAATSDTPLGTELTLSAQAAYSDGDVRNVSNSSRWSTSDESIIIVDSTGVATALSLGNVDVYVEYEGYVASQTFTVTEAELKAITLSPDGPFETFEGAVFVATAEGTYTDDSRGDVSAQVTWSSSNTEVGSVSNHSDNPGRIQAKTVGTTTIQANLNGYIASFELSVVELPLVSIDITTEPLSSSNGMTPQIMRGSTMPTLSMEIGSGVPAGLTIQLYAIGTFENGDVADVTAAVGWTIADTGIAQLTAPDSEPGKVRGRAVGSTMVSVEADNGVTGSFNLTVIDAVISGLKIRDEDLTPLYVGDERALNLFADFSDGSQTNVTSEAAWQSSDPSILYVFNEQARKGTVRAQRLGSELVSASTNGLTVTESIETISPISATTCRSIGNECRELSLPYLSLGTTSISRIPAPEWFDLVDPIKIEVNSETVRVTEISTTNALWGCRILGVEEDQVFNKGDQFEVKFQIARTYGETKSCFTQVQFNNSDDIQLRVNYSVTTN